jgi:hypothetical protein
MEKTANTHDRKNGVSYQEFSKYDNIKLKIPAGKFEISTRNFENVIRRSQSSILSLSCLKLKKSPHPTNNKNRSKITLKIQFKTQTFIQRIHYKF